MNLILLGAPGAGKGTQAEVICEKLNIPSISTGNILRDAVKNQTEAGIAAAKFMESGQLVPDEVVINVLKDRIAQADCKNGFILDGFPRTVPQAQALDKMGVIIDKVIDIEVPDENILARLSGRRVCEKCGSSYHILHKKPQNENLCDKCNGDLIQRKDDLPETIKSRLCVYHDQTEPLKDYYSKFNKLIEIDGVGTVQSTTDK
ncbi:MAG: adenylate kinase, partial [Oscillospiraceae bacterium]